MKKIATIQKVLQDNFLCEYGGFHDSSVSDIIFRPKQKVLVLFLDDLYANFMGEIDYRYKKGQIIFENISLFDLKIELMTLDNLDIYEILCDENNSSQVINIKFAPTGLIRVACEKLVLFED